MQNIYQMQKSSIRLTWLAMQDKDQETKRAKRDWTSENQIVREYKYFWKPMASVLLESVLLTIFYLDEWKFSWKK